VTIYLGLMLPPGSSDQPGDRPGFFIPLFGLAPDGVCTANRSPGCRWALTSPFHPYPDYSRRYVSVALSVGLPLLGVTQHPARRSSDFPPR